MLRSDVVRELKFLDETHYSSVWTGSDEHDLCARAYGRADYSAGVGENWFLPPTTPPPRWVAGVLPLPWADERCCDSPIDWAVHGDINGFGNWWAARRGEAWRGGANGDSGPMWGVPCVHDEVRALPEGVVAGLRAAA